MMFWIVELTVAGEDADSAWAQLGAAAIQQMEAKVTMVAMRFMLLLR